MDEIWEDIHLISSLHRPNPAVPTNTAVSNRLQDFLPIFKKVNAPPPPSSPSFAVGNDDVGIINTTVRPPPTTSTAITTLDLGPKFRQSRNVKKKSKPKKPPSLVITSPSKEQEHKVKLVPCVTCSNSINNKRPAEEEELGMDENSAEGRFKRMIKNRETAARCRDKKHAYTYELELELTRLKKENTMLRKQQQQQYMLRLPADPPTQLPKKPTLSRSLTAPF